MDCKTFCVQILIFVYRDFTWIIRNNGIEIVFFSQNLFTCKLNITTVYKVVLYFQLFLYKLSWNHFPNWHNRVIYDMRCIYFLCILNQEFYKKSDIFFIQYVQK